MSGIKYFEPLDLYKTPEGNYLMESGSKPLQISEKRPDYIEVLKEMNRQYLINLKTGGPLRNSAKEFLNTYPFSKEDKQYIEKEVFGDSAKTIREKEEFKLSIRTLYFPLDKLKNKFIFENINFHLWNDKKWRDFKEKQVFSHFISKNFHRDLFDCLDFEFHKKDDNTIESLKSVKLKGCIDSIITNIEYNPKKLPTISNPSFTTNNWKWDNDNEYKRLQIPGKRINEMKHTLNTGGFWVPLRLNDRSKTITNSHYITSRNEFDVYDPSRIIALVAFKSADNTLKLATRIDLFESSYYFYILSLIDKTLNEAIMELLNTKNKTQFDEFQRLNFT